MKKFIVGVVVMSSLSAVACAPAEEAEEGESSALAASAQAVYDGDNGCQVKVEPRLNQVSITVERGTTWAAFGYRRDLSRSDIITICNEAVATQEGSVVTVACAEQRNDRVTTRGKATIRLNGELADATTGSLRAVEVLLEKKGWLFWEKDTDLTCKNLRLRR